jgi:hypothetical protein
MLGSGGAPTKLTSAGPARIPAPKTAYGLLVPAAAAAVSFASILRRIQ